MSGADDEAELGEPIARGRSADLYDLGDGTVLRRVRGHPIRPAEVAAMRLAETAGFPVPHVHRADGADMVLDRIDGRDLLGLLGDRPWRVRRYARLLADLHLQLRVITPDDPALGATGEREALVHGDLHPGNVMMAASGPVVIDWENARAGPDDFDAATTWLLTETAEPDDVPTLVRPILTLIRMTFSREFLGRVGSPRPETVALVCDERLDDPNMRPTERDRIAEFRARHAVAASTR